MSEDKEGEFDNIGELRHALSILGKKGLRLDHHSSECAMAEVITPAEKKIYFDAVEEYRCQIEKVKAKYMTIPSKFDRSSSDFRQELFALESKLSVTVREKIGRELSREEKYYLAKASGGEWEVYNSACDWARGNLCSTEQNRERIGERISE